MLKVYAVPWCPHCQMTVDFLSARNIPFQYLHIEQQPRHVVQQVIDVNGGEDWVVPTLEFHGQWRPGKVFDPEELENDLIHMGVLPLPE